MCHSRRNSPGLKIDVILDRISESGTLFHELSWEIMSETIGNVPVDKTVQLETVDDTDGV